MDGLDVPYSQHINNNPGEIRLAALAQQSTKQCQSTRSFLCVPPRNGDKVGLRISDWDEDKKLTGIDQICLGPFALICSPVAAALSHHQLDCQCCNTAREGFWLGGFVLLH